MKAGPAMAVREVSHRYERVPVLRGTTLDVAPGEVHCLLGPSGSGKSTLLRLIAGLETLQDGCIEIAGREVSAASIHVAPEHRAVGFVFQDFALFPHLDVRSNVVFGMPPRPAMERKQAADALLLRVGMADFADAMPHTLSGGQQQRVALVRALARRPAVMLLDEPFSGLDARLREDVRATALDVLRASGVATLMVTHDPQEAMAVADRVSVIRNGQVLQTGSPDEVYRHFHSRDVAEVFGRINSLRARVDRRRVTLPWGLVSAGHLEDGDDVDVLFRPEALRVLAAPEPEGATARVVDIEREGVLLRIHLELEDGPRIEALEFNRSRRVGSVRLKASQVVGIEVGEGDVRILNVSRSQLSGGESS